MAEYLVTENVKITNYKPIPDRKQNDNDMNITNDENFNVKVSDNYKNLFDALKDLDGDKTSLSSRDIALARNLNGKFNIMNVLLDNKIVRFVFNDGTNLRIDMSIDDKPAIKNLKNDIAKGNATYESGILNYLLQCITPHTPQRGAEIALSNIPANVKTLGDLKQHYGLPDGCLRNNIPQGGGDLDKYPIEGTVYIHVASLAKGLGITTEQIEALFK